MLIRFSLFKKTLYHSEVKYSLNFGHKIKKGLEIINLYSTMNVKCVIIWSRLAYNQIWWVFTPPKIKLSKVAEILTADYRGISRGNLRFLCMSFQKVASIWKWTFWNSFVYMRGSIARRFQNLCWRKKSEDARGSHEKFPCLPSEKFPV